MHRFAATLDRYLDAGLIFLLVFTPLSFGAVEDWAKAIAQVVLMLVVVAWIVSRLYDPASSPLRRTGLEAPACLFIVAVMLQLIPLPPSLLRAISPRTAEIYSISLPGHGAEAETSFSGLDRWLAESVSEPHGQTAIVGPGLQQSELHPQLFERSHPPWRSLSLAPATTGRALQILLAHAVLLFLVFNRIDRESRALLYLRVLAGLAGTVALLAILQRLTSVGQLYWWRAAGSGSEPFGPFVSRNNFAGWIELILPICAGLAAAFWTDRRRETLSKVAPDSSSPAGLLFGFVTVFSLAAFLFAGSRGGLLSLASAVFVYACFVLVRERPKPTTIVVMIGVVLLSVGLVAWIGGSETWSRYETLGDVQSEPSFRFRLTTTIQTLGMFADFPIFGTGLGTFEQAFMLYTDGTAYKALRYAHNDYAQLLSEVGLLGGLAMLWAIVILVRRGLMPGLTRLGWSLRWPLRGVAVGVLALLIHSFVDFNLRIYSNSFLFVFLCALLLRDGATNLDLNGVTAGRMTGRMATRDPSRT